MVTTHRWTVTTAAQGDAHDLTAVVAGALATSGLAAGVVTVFVVGSTAAITTLEFEDGVISDLDRALEQIAPRHGEYAHHQRWHDDNGSSHVRAALMGPSVTVPFVNGRMALDTWQQIALIELDTRGRAREIVVQIMGE